MRFVADVMLGRLARWLRLMGFDVAYDRNAGDRELVRISRSEGRTLLTRDTRLAARKGVDSVLIESDDVGEQLRQLGEMLDPADAAPHGRCDVCNGMLNEVTDRTAVRDLVPEHVYRSAPSFSICGSCGRVYWPGTHYRSFHGLVDGMMRARHED